MSRDQFAYEKFILELKNYKSRPGMTLDKMLKAMDCSGITSEGFLSEVINGKKKANAAMVFAFENLLDEERGTTAEPLTVADKAINFSDKVKLNDDQKEILRLWEDIDKNDRDTAKAVLKRFARRQ